MNKVIAEKRDLLSVQYMIYMTINDVYPAYYPNGIVEYLISKDDKAHILQDIEDKKVLLFTADDFYIATATINDNEISRLYILPEYQGKGYGTQIMDILENTVLKKHSKVRVSASFPSQSFFRKRGFREYYFDRIKTGSGDYFCYCTMVLKNKSIQID